MLLLRKILFGWIAIPLGWLASLFEWLAGFTPDKDPEEAPAIPTNNTEHTRLTELLGKASLSAGEKFELSSLLEETDEVVLLE
jgi:hypothetical protein